MPFEKGHIPEGAKPFKPDDERINRKGRPRKLIADVSKHLSDNGVKPATAEQIRAIFMQFVNLPENELQELVSDKAQPMLNKIVIKAMLGGKGFEVIKDLVERAHGKPKEHVEHTGQEPIKITIVEGTENK